MHKKREFSGKKWARYGLKGVKGSGSPAHGGDQQPGQLEDDRHHRHDGVEDQEVDVCPVAVLITPFGGLDALIHEPVVRRGRVQLAALRVERVLNSTQLEVN